MSTQSQKPKIILLGLDGLEWNILNPLIREGALPAFESLVREGTSGDLRTLHPTLSPMLWNSIATGKRAEQHGIHGFSEVDPSSGTVRPVSSISRKCKAVWNILMQSGFDCHVVNWFASHPAEPLNGSSVSDLFPEGATPAGQAWPLRPGTVHPLELRRPLAALRIGPDEVAPDLIRMLVPRAAEVDQAKDRKLHVIANELAKAYTIHSTATWLLENRSWDFCAAYWRTPDILKHHFMPYHPPALEGIDERAFELYREVIPGVYRLFDAMLARYLELLPTDATILVVSDHGFQTGPSRPRFHENPFVNPEAWHRDHGVFIAKGPLIAKGERVFGARLVDICPTILTLSGLPPARDMAGRVLSEIFQTPPQLTTINSWETVAGECGRHAPDTKYAVEDAEALLKQFVALGYIDPIDPDHQVAARQTERTNKLNLAREWLDEGRPGMALPFLEELFTELPGALDIGRLLLHTQRLLGFYKEAEMTSRQLCESMEEGPLTMLSRAQIALDQRDFTGGLHQLKKIEESYPSFLGIQREIGRVYNRLGRFAEAEACFQQIVERDDTDALAYQGLAFAQVRLRKPMEAMTSALAAIERKPDLPMAHYQLALAAERVGLRDHAIRALGVSLAYAPRNRLAHKLLSILLRKTGDHEKAAKHEEVAQLLIAQREEEKAARAKLRELVVKSAEARAEKRRQTRIPPPVDIQKTDTPAPVVEPGGREYLIVSGAPRSGTSLMMQILKAGGKELLVDAHRPADENNPEGYFEYEPIKKLRQNPKAIEQGEGKAAKVVSMLLKHLPKNHTYKVIYMLRHPAEVAESQARMIKQMNTASPERDVGQMAKLLSSHIDETLEFLKQTGNVRLLTVEYADLIADPEKEIRRLVEFVDEPAFKDVTKMAGVVNPRLWRTRAG